MKVYAVKEQYTFESVTESRVTLYDSKEKALAKFKAVVEDEKKNSWINELPNVIIETDTEGDFFAYLDGRGAEYQTDIVVQELVVY